MSYRSLCLLIPLLLTACDDDETSVTPDGGVDAGGCQTLTIGARDLAFNAFGQLTGVTYAVSGRDDRLRVELYDSTTGGLPPLATGSFDLAAAPNDNLATCQHCVWLPVDWDEVSPLGTVFLATSGTLTLDRVSDPLEPEFAGSTGEIVLREATVDESGATSLVDGGACLRVEALAFDTRATPGADCLSAEDCGNPLLEICQPSDHTCGPFQCGDFNGCQGENQICLSQYRDLFDGACYQACDPTTMGECAEHETCVQLGVDWTFGVCRLLGEGTTGQTCEREDTSTSCVAGDVCSRESETCTHVCDFFAADPGCQDGALCNVLGVCEPPASGVDVAFGAACGAVELADGCAPDGEAFRGICFAYRPEDPLICEEACLGTFGCEEGEFCALRFSSGLGVCKPIPVCGDGELGEINEVCDDGDEESGDGCSADCQTVEYEPICAGLSALPASVSGDTRDGWDGFKASCQLGTARAELFTFTPPSAGRLTLNLTSSTVQVVSVRETCAVDADEGCSENGRELVLQLTSAEALTVMVSAATVIDEGPFVLMYDFVPEDCGDGVIAGNEVCDDGDEEGGDGCSADCRTVEYDVLCSQASPLVTTISGTTVGAADYYEPSCTNTFFGSGPDRLHRYVATATGTVRFRLEQGAADLALAVYSSCGDPAGLTELGCSSVVDVEEVDVPVVMGDELTLVVDGFDGDDAGPYVLTATML